MNTKDTNEPHNTKGTKDNKDNKINKANDKNELTAEVKMGFTPVTTEQWNNIEEKLTKLGWQGLLRKSEHFKSHPEEAHWLNTLCQYELEEKQHKSYARRLKASKLKCSKPLSEFDWAWPTDCNTERIKGLLSLDFIRAHENAIFMGPTGIGKTMLASNLGDLALSAGMTVYFTTAAKLLNEIEMITNNGKLRLKLNRLAKYDLLIIDELGYKKFSNRHADILYEIIESRHKQKSTVITTNLLLSEWYSLFDNNTTVIPLIDRLIEKCYIVKIEAKSYRYKQAMESSES
ncbi:IS21-like element helper ATPase IstB [Thorsellia anophelis]|uniref:IstB transposition helper protein n=1 Tax=Thorsellia anophelis DSM 18579 TaxID=1123402 RepID=A0A1I0EU77_9GAMM|nr:IS21-like element helper ATPase IstB [Thorsellia anophelis]SET49099.1 IstB transposition helper protein [Thorsellia anophelis DSM 18579]